MAAAHFLLEAVLCGFVFTLLVFPQSSSAPSRAVPLSPALTDIAREELSSDPAFEKTRVSLTDHILLVDLSPAVPPDSFGPKDRYGLPLEAMIRALAFRRDFSKFFPDDRFWAKPVESIEDAAHLAIDQGGIADEASGASFRKTIAAHVDELAAFTRIAAQEKHLDLRTSRDPVLGYHVQIVIRPPTTRVHYMRFLAYEECQKAPATADGRADCMRKQWNDLNEGTLMLIGRYRYRAAWGKDFGGDEEGTFSIATDSVVTLHPPRTGKDYGK